MSATAASIAAALRARIRAGEIQPDERLPTMEQLMEAYGTTRGIARQALAVLKNEGLAEYRAGRSMGTFVRRQPVERQVRSRLMERDDMGYYSGPGVQHWRQVPGTRTVTGGKPVPADIANLLDVEPGTPVPTRDRFIGDPGRPEYRQAVDSWLHPEVVAALPGLRGTTGLGGMYDRIEEWAGQPISWEEEVTAAIPSPGDADMLLLPSGVAVLRILRTSTVEKDGKKIVVEVQDIRMSSDLFSVKYPLLRHGDAEWPVRPAGSDFYSA